MGPGDHPIAWTWSQRPTWTTPEMVRRELWVTLLTHIAADEVADRPGRIEPRVLKCPRDSYPRMKRLRAQLQAEPGKA